MATTTIIPFDEIVPGATVRFTVIDGVQYLSVRDLIMVMCNKTNQEAARTLSRMAGSFQKELLPFWKNFQFPGRGQSEQPVIQFQGAMKLLMWLPGEQAKQFRSKASDILTRYFAGDKTLLIDICANAESQNVINQAARAALPDSEHAIKRKALELEIQEEALQMSRVERHLKTVHLQRDLMEMFALVSPGGQLDDRTRLHFKDIIVNLSSAAAGKVIIKSPDAPLTISTVAAELGLHLTTDELKIVGAKISKLYLAKYGAHEQQCGGATRPVRSYTERDRDLVEQELRNYIRG